MQRRCLAFVVLQCHIGSHPHGATCGSKSSRSVFEATTEDALSLLQLSNVKNHREEQGRETEKQRDTEASNQSACKAVLKMFEPEEMPTLTRLCQQAFGAASCAETSAILEAWPWTERVMEDACTAISSSNPQPAADRLPALLLLRSVLAQKSARSEARQHFEASLTMKTTTPPPATAPPRLPPVPGVSGPPRVNEQQPIVNQPPYGTTPTPTGNANAPGSTTTTSTAEPYYGAPAAPYSVTAGAGLPNRDAEDARVWCGNSTGTQDTSGCITSSTAPPTTTLNMSNTTTQPPPGDPILGTGVYRNIVLMEELTEAELGNPSF